MARNIDRRFCFFKHVLTAELVVDKRLQKLGHVRLRRTRMAVHVSQTHYGGAQGVGSELEMQLTGSR